MFAVLHMSIKQFLFSMFMLYCICQSNDLLTCLFCITYVNQTVSVVTCLFCIAYVNQEVYVVTMLMMYCHRHFGTFFLSLIINQLLVEYFSEFPLKFFDCFCYYIL